MNEQSEQQAYANKEIVRAFIEEVWATGKTERVSDYVAPDYVAHALRSKIDIIGVEGSKNNAVGTRKRFPNLDVEIRDIIADDDRVACYLILKSHPDGEAQQEVKEEMVIFKLRNRLLTECWSIGTDWEALPE